jgi:hypothetical protein
MSPFEGEMSDPIVYESAYKIAPCTFTAVERCLQRGFALADIAMVSMSGSSAMQGLYKLGPWS